MLVKHIYSKIIEASKLLKTEPQSEHGGYDKSPYLARKQSRNDGANKENSEPVARRDSLRKAHSTTADCSVIKQKTTEASIADFYTAQLNSAMRANGANNNVLKDPFFNNNNNAQKNAGGSGGTAAPPTFEAQCYIEHGRINFGKLITDEILSADHKLVQQAKLAVSRGVLTKYTY